MPSSLNEQIAALSDDDSLIAGRALIVLLDLKLQKEPKADRPQGIDTTNFKSILQSAN